MGLSFGLFPERNPLVSDSGRLGMTDTTVNYSNLWEHTLSNEDSTTGNIFNMFDGSTTTYFSLETANDAGVHQSITYDFREEVTFAFIFAYARGNCTGNNENDSVKIEHSNNNTDWTLLENATSYDAPAELNHTSSNITCRYIKITQTGTRAAGPAAWGLDIHQIAFQKLTK